ncbi:7,8-didemethyl-8-hydroxy-5-deazariboflavin synthase subunit CofH [Cyanobacterium sp. Dongsha4]|uniref:7,8-didemethyl-8-hydroxy-5-deazariboflavin synthase subunit CofH n=1 Tax=Cyanobacterium sp. DS4 TaxID=2878255 RepID=UPI002E802173|nr:7,8-didemethyl-8-hydroxy-5-deazariboflavin synthase subunit CofH [Cyanobacterium sp. Dongsha4]WVL01555.1 7,8-didemethyl-8-hydroxy-5-deazariboflavin synthase subunit CofH [Cyanobacterium sp. Dongsha4]
MVLKTVSPFISFSEGVRVLQSNRQENKQWLQNTADEMRHQQVGDTVTYVINRNINFTNICEQHCSFCAFRRDQGEEGAFWLEIEDIIAKSSLAVEKGATEICMQGGLNPLAKVDGSSLKYYLKLIGEIKKSFPQLHLHAFSPQEVQFIAREDGLSYDDVIVALRDGGVNSLPGTAAEVLDDTVRKIICPEKIDTQTWMDIISKAHRWGLYTTSTMLCGHVETYEQEMLHLTKVRSLQELALEKGYPARITEFILLPFVGEYAPQPLRKRVGKIQPDLDATLKLTAVARLFLGDIIPNHQPSWVKLGLHGAIEALSWGCNDIGGTLMEEHITTMAGAKGGTCLEVQEIQDAIASINRPSRQRNTLYTLL